MLSNIYSALLVPSLLFLFVSSEAMVDLQSVGAMKSLSAKSTICNILDYGAVADDKTDVGPAIAKAFASCALKGGAMIYIPPGSYSRKSNRSQ
jgi:rhamnogalacturonan hydrolase